MLGHANPWGNMKGAMESSVLRCRENIEVLNCIAWIGANILGFLRLKDETAQRCSVIDKTGLNLEMRDVIEMMDFNLCAVGLAHIKV